MAKSAYNEMGDHDLLVQLNVKQDGLEKQFTNHLHHHWMVTIAAIGAGLSGLLAFASLIFMKLIESGIFKGS